MDQEVSGQDVFVCWENVVETQLAGQSHTAISEVRVFQSATLIIIVYCFIGDTRSEPMHDEICANECFNGCWICFY